MAKATAENSSPEIPGIVGGIPPTNWGTSLTAILQSEFNGILDEDACGLYKLEISETRNGKDFYFIEVNQDVKTVVSANETGGASPDGRNPDVTVTMSSSDLTGVLAGTLAPLQAYLTGRISASGDVRKLMVLIQLLNSI